MRRHRNRRQRATLWVIRGLGADVALESSIWMGFGEKLFLLHGVTAFTTTPFTCRPFTGAVRFVPLVIPFCCKVTMLRGPVWFGGTFIMKTAEGGAPNFRPGAAAVVKRNDIHLRLTPERNNSRIYMTPSSFPVRYFKKILTQKNPEDSTCWIVENQVRGNHRDRDVFSRLDHGTQVELRVRF